MPPSTSSHPRNLDPGIPRPARKPTTPLPSSPTARVTQRQSSAVLPRPSTPRPDPHRFRCKIEVDCAGTRAGILADSLECSVPGRVARSAAPPCNYVLHASCNYLPHASRRSTCLVGFDCVPSCMPIAGLSGSHSDRLSRSIPMQKMELDFPGTRAGVLEGGLECIVPGRAPRHLSTDRRVPTNAD